MLKKIKGFSQTHEAAGVMAAVGYRAAGASLFQAPAPSTPKASVQAPSR